MTIFHSQFINPSIIFFILSLFNAQNISQGKEVKKSRTLHYMGDTIRNFFIFKQDFKNIQITTSSVLTRRHLAIRNLEPNDKQPKFQLYHHHILRLGHVLEFLYCKIRYYCFRRMREIIAVIYIETYHGFLKKTDVLKDVYKNSRQSQLS